MASEHTWIWMRSRKKPFKVISDPEKGIIEVYNESGEIVIRKENLSRRQVEFVEKNYLSMVARKVGDHLPRVTPKPVTQDPFDPMIS
jgi:hypothetical protein